MIKAKYPSIEHENAAQALVDFFAGQDVDAVILTCSCARGKASRGSCLDIAILMSPEKFAAHKNELERRWDEFYESEAVFESLHRLGKFSHVDLEFTDGRFEPQQRGWTSGPDNFELEIGNTVAYTVPLLERTGYFFHLKEQWLPYYNDRLRQRRLADVRKYCLNNLDHIPLYVERGLHFQAFHRLYDAYREFLQALFISRRTYPIAYDKWIREQVVEILEMPELYNRLVGLLEISDFESDEIACKGKELGRLFGECVVE